jgi:hypothetical protein
MIVALIEISVRPVFGACGTANSVLRQINDRDDKPT